MWSGLVRRLGTRRIAIAGVALAAWATLAASGGLAPAPVAAQPTLKVGQALDAGPWRIRPLRAWRSEHCPLDGAQATAGNFVSVEAELTNLTAASRNVVADAFELQQPVLPRDTIPGLELVRDRAVLGYLQPHLPERVVLCWPLPSQLVVPPSVTLALRATQFKQRDNLTGGEGWFNPKQVARVELPLGEPDADALRAGHAP
jgi:hypothetical protein